MPHTSEVETKGRISGALIPMTIPIEMIDPHPENPRRHPDEQLVGLSASYDELGQFRTFVVWARPGGRYVQVTSHGITEAMRREGAKEVRVEVLPSDTDPLVVKQIMLADNLHALHATDDEVVLATLLQEQQNAGTPLVALGSSDEALQSLLDALSDQEAGLLDEITRPEKNARPNPRILPLDMIYTLQMADCTCCLAVQAGLKYGIQSAHYRLCPYTNELSGRHMVVFIDNDYFHYDHAVHLAAVRDLRPKYATVCDIMTPHQCREDRITHYPLEQILDWAEELSEYAENVIVIPKYDCIEKIPEKFMLGYSIPTSHGGTPLPLDAFRGRRIHLLGGSWKAQLAYLADFGEDVVSIDNNQVGLLASRFGSFTEPDGETRSLTEIGLGALNNPRYAALALSFGSIGAKLSSLFSAEGTEDGDEEGEE